MDHLLVTEQEVGKKAAGAYVHSLVLDDLEGGVYVEDGDADQYMGMIDEVDDFLDTTGALAKGLYDFGVVLGTSAGSGDLVHRQMLVDGAFVPGQGDLYVLMGGKGESEGESEGEGEGGGTGGGGGDAAVVEAIAGSIGNLTNKDVRPLFASYRSYESVEAMREALVRRWGDPDRNATSTLGGIDWRDSGAENGLRVDLYVESSDPTVRWAQSVNIAFNAYLRRFNDSSVTLAGVKDMPRRQSELRIDFSILLGPLLTVWIMHIVLPVEMYYLVYEKERSLRVYQYLNGLRPGVYYVATWSAHLLMYLLTMATFVSLGYAFGIKMMVLNSFSVQLVFYTLWGAVVTSAGFVASKLFKEKRSVTLLSFFYVLVSGFIANVFLVLFVEQDMHVVLGVMQSLIPSFCAFRGLYELSSYAFLADQTNGPGLQWRTFGSDPGMLGVLVQLTVQSLVIPLLAMYLERDWLFFFGGRRNVKAKEGIKVKMNQTDVKAVKDKYKDDALENYLGYFSSGGAQFDSDEMSATSSQDPVARRDSSMGYYFGVEKGEKALGAMTAGMNTANTSTHDADDDDDASGGPSVVYRGVRKDQNNNTTISIPCLAVHDREIFCFLTDDQTTASTLLMMVQGLSVQDDGTILVRGKDSRQFVGTLRNRIGIVFNGDILFEDLTGHEHLSYYAHTRLPPDVNDADVDRYIQNAIDVLELHSAIQNPVSKYSSGMRRRLSLAIALLGYPDRARLPDVLLMHEPSRSMDPYSRKVLWRALGSIRQKTAIVIATGSISEAEACDRIAIMKGTKVWQGNPNAPSVISPAFVGSPQHLIFKRGRFMFLSFTVAEGGQSHRSKQDIIRFVRQHIVGAEILENWGHKLKFKVPLKVYTGEDDDVEDEDVEVESQTIDSVFRTVERARAANTLAVLDYKVHNCNLEDVYLDYMTT